MNKTDTWIQTSSGGSIDLINPKPEEIKIRDIAHALSNICRFGGHCRWHYSVAQHSVLVSYLVPAELALDALLHDAAEAYLGDIVRPLKVNGDMQGYKEAEKLMESVICKTFDLGDLNHPEIKKADMQMLAAEKKVLLRDQTTPWLCLEGVEVPEVEIESLSPRQAKMLFLNRVNKLALKVSNEKFKLLTE